MTPILSVYLSDLQIKAMQASCLASAMNAVMDYPEHREISHALLDKVCVLVDELNVALDHVSLPKGGDA